MPNVTFTNWNRSIRSGALANVRTIAKLAGLSLYNGAARMFNCHGMGTCGTCRVKVEPEGALTPPTFFERMHGCTGPMRLACQAQIASDRADVRITKMEGFLGKGDVPASVE